MFWFFRKKRETESRKMRELLEDALKVFYSQREGEEGETCEGLARKLFISCQKAGELLHRLVQRGLAREENGKVFLTSAGKALGLHLLRAHRLYERYLADNTDVPLKEIHGLADRKEHQLSREEVQDLEARLGYPSSDPHGDVIPDEQGEVRHIPPLCLPLSQWTPGKPAQIVHIEDEPESAFAQIISAGLLPGSRVVIEHISEKGMKLDAEGNVIWLAPFLADYVEVCSPVEQEETPFSARRLSDLKPGEKGRVLGISPTVRGLARRRLLDLGFTPGALVEAVLQSSFGRGDPTAYRIRGTVIALRKEQAQGIFLQPEGGEK
ncbi:MAG: metal-dependent transcriptional regulator [bacterium JZ-2024 1]